jgi:segregation and condensation protein B
LSKPALETLAIVAYKQPVTRLEIELLRNVNIDGVVKTLLDKSLIRIAGRKKAPGRPFAFGTTRQFLEYFGLKSLEELPRMEEFSSLVEKNELELTDVGEEKNAEVLHESGGVT